jgi:hypothetical protein
MPIKNLIAKVAKKKDKTSPPKQCFKNSKSNSEKALTDLMNAAPASVGTARKKLNSVASLGFKPADKPPMMVAAALETPGMKAKH